MYAYKYIYTCMLAMVTLLDSRRGQREVWAKGVEGNPPPPPPLAPQLVRSLFTGNVSSLPIPLPLPPNVKNTLFLGQSFIQCPGVWQRLQM